VWRQCPPHRRGPPQSKLEHAILKVVDYRMSQPFSLRPFSLRYPGCVIAVDRPGTNTPMKSYSVCVQSLQRVSRIRSFHCHRIHSLETRFQRSNPVAVSAKSRASPSARQFRVVHSWRSATAGSIRAARQAGKHAENIAAIRSAPSTLIQVTASVSSTPNN